MRNESVEKILKNLQLPEAEQLPMTANQRNMMADVKACLSIMEEDMMMPTPDLRDRLMREIGCSQSHAYDVIWIANMAPERRSTSKNKVREFIMEMMREARKVARTLEPERQVDALVKIANTLARAFATSDDDGETLDAAQYLTYEAVRITTDPSAIGIRTNEQWREKVRKLKQKFHIDEAEFEEVGDDSNGREHPEEP